MTFVEITLALCKERKITKNKMLVDLGLGKSSFLNWQQRGTIPSGEVLQKIADYFGVTIDYLLGKTNTPSPETGENANNKASQCMTKSEKDLLAIYRELDFDGKTLVSTIAKHELDRVMRVKGLIPSKVAARSADGEETVHTEYLPDLSAIPADDTDL